MSEWRKSSHSAYNGSCVEVRCGPHGVAVRDSKDPGGPVLEFTREAWREFLAQAAPSRTPGR